MVGMGLEIRETVEQKVLVPHKNLGQNIVLPYETQAKTGDVIYGTYCAEGTMMP